MPADKYEALKKELEKARRDCDSAISALSAEVSKHESLLKKKDSEVKDLKYRESALQEQLISSRDDAKRHVGEMEERFKEQEQKILSLEADNENLKRQKHTLLKSG